MDLINHPAYARLRDALVKRFRRPSYSFKNLRHVIFLCGAADSHVRNRIAEYLRRHHPNKLLFYADHVWKHLAQQHAVIALDMERQLAQLADVVVVVVESPGTFAELGAFSLSEDLRKKLLPILEVRYKDVPSFINTGPIRWVDKDSKFAPSIYANFSVILSAIGEIEDRLKRIPALRRSTEHAVDVASSPKHQFFLLCDLLAIIGPATVAHCSYYLEKIFAPHQVWKVEWLLGLGLSMGIIQEAKAPAAMKMYYRPLENGSLEPFQHKRMFDLSAERAKFLSILQQIEPAGPASRIAGVR